MKRKKNLCNLLAASMFVTLLQGGTIYAADIEESASTKHYVLESTVETVEWGVIDTTRDPVLSVDPGDSVTVRTLTHQAGNDYDRMIKGDAAIEEIYEWTSDGRNIDQRGPGAHIVVGPIFVNGAKPGDVLEIDILDMVPRASLNPEFEGKAFGANVAANWGYLHKDLLDESGNPVNYVTVFEIGKEVAQAVYGFKWENIVDPQGKAHPSQDTQGLIVDHTNRELDYSVLSSVQVPIRLHSGIIATAPNVKGRIDTTSPTNIGGNVDNHRITIGSKLYLPVEVEGALIYLADSHAAQGDCELNGTAIETSIDTTIQVNLHKNNEMPNYLQGLNYPLIENEDSYVVTGYSEPDYLKEMGPETKKADILAVATQDKAMKDASLKALQFIEKRYGLTTFESYAVLSTAVDFGVTQVVDANLGVHAIIYKDCFETEKQMDVPLSQAIVNLGGTVALENNLISITLNNKKALFLADQKVGKLDNQEFTLRKEITVRNDIAYIDTLTLNELLKELKK